MRPIQRTSNAITEKPIFIRLGFFLFLLKPTTLAQIYEVGAILEDVNQLELPQEKLNPVSKMLELYKNLDVCSEIIVILLFRSRWKRWLWRKYIKSHITMATYKQVIEYCAEAFQATFFLTSLTFLKGIKQTTATTNTPEATPFGAL